MNIVNSWLNFFTWIHWLNSLILNCSWFSFKSVSVREQILLIQSNNDPFFAVSSLWAVRLLCCCCSQAMATGTIVFSLYQFHTFLYTPSTLNPKPQTAVPSQFLQSTFSFFCPRSFDRAVMVAQWYYLRLTTRETRVRILPWASSGHVTTRSMSPQHLRSPMLIFATKKRSSGSNGQKEDAASFFCPRRFDRAVMQQQTSGDDAHSRLGVWKTWRHWWTTLDVNGIRCHLQKRVGYPGITRPVTYPAISQDKVLSSQLEVCLKPAIRFSPLEKRTAGLSRV